MKYLLGKAKEEEALLFLTQLGSEQQLGISYTLRLLNDYIGLGKRDTLRVIHPTFF